MLQFRAPSRHFSWRIAALLRGSCGALLSFISLVASATPGQLDLSFGASGVVYDTSPDLSAFAQSVVVQVDGRIVVSGSCYIAPPVEAYQACLRRYGSDGLIDRAFGANGRVVLDTPRNGYAPAVALQEDGKIVTAGTCGDVLIYGLACVVRYLSNGMTDTAFGVNGRVALGSGYANAISIKLDGSIFAAGSCGGARYLTLMGPFDFCIWQVTPLGELDSSYGTSGFARTDFSGADDAAYGIALTDDGRVLATGGCMEPVTNPTYGSICTVRYMPNGTLDVAFGVVGKVANALFGGIEKAAIVRLQSDGKVVVGGQCNTSQGCVIRYTADGASDLSFGIGGIVAIPTGVFDLAIQLDGRIVVLGNCAGRLCATRLKSNGATDADYGVNNAADSGLQGFNVYGGAKPSLVLQKDGKALVVGTCVPDVYYSDFCLARFLRGPYDPLTCALNADANNTIESSTDALLILRYLLGYRGAALTNGALGSNPTRTGHALETHLASLNLDADGDGQVHAMTDGLLILRAMLGLSGNALTAGTVNTSSPTVRNAQQILTWIESTHGVACLP